MRIAISGASGLVGSALTEHLQSAGSEVMKLVRAPDGSFEPIPECDAVVHLAGENIADGRWTAVKKRRIRDSRVELTSRLVEMLAKMERPPDTLISASAVGYYGDRGDERLDETSTMGSGFLAEVCRDWEAAAASATGLRVVCLRLGMVLSPKRRRARADAIAIRIGSRWSPRHRTSVDELDPHHRPFTDDRIRVGTRADVEGACNAVAPEPVTNLEFTKALGRAMRRPTILPVPKFALRNCCSESWPTPCCCRAARSFPAA